MRSENERKPTRESLEKSLNEHLKTAEYKNMKKRAIKYIRKVRPDIFVMHDFDAQKMLGTKTRTQGNLHIIYTEIFANSCIHLWRWRNDGLVTPAYQLLIVVNLELDYDYPTRINYAWQPCGRYNRDGLPFSDSELPLVRYTLRLDERLTNDVDICEELGIDNKGVIWRNGHQVLCHRASYQAYRENVLGAQHYCSINCSKCKEHKNEIRRICSEYGICLGNAGRTILDGSLNMRLVANI